MSNNDGNRVSKTEYRAERLFQDYCFPGEVTCWTLCNPSIIVFKIRQFKDAYRESDCSQESEAYQQQCNF